MAPAMDPKVAKALRLALGGQSVKVALKQTGYPCSEENLANICSSPSAIIPNTLLVETPEDTPEDDVCHLPSHMMNGVSYVVEYSLV